MKEFKIGREGSNDFIIENDSVSSHHAIVQISGDFKTFVLKDNDSTNGSFVDGQEIISKTITKKSEINIGEYHLNNLYFFEKLEAFIHENRKDFSIEFEVLMEVEEKYKHKKENLKKNYQIKTLGLRLVITIVLLGALSTVLEPGQMIGATIILGGIASAVTIYSPAHKKIEQLSDELFVEYVHEFVCPKCKMELVSKSWNYWRSKKNCPKCKCTWVNK